MLVDERDNVEYRFGVLGPLAVSRDGLELKVGGARVRQLAVRLVVAANSPIEPGQLAEDLWDGRPPRVRRQRCRATSPRCDVCSARTVWSIGRASICLLSATTSWMCDASSA